MRQNELGSCVVYLNSSAFLSPTGICCSSHLQSLSGFGLASSTTCPAVLQACSIGSSRLGWPNLNATSFHHLLFQCVSCHPRSHPAGTLDIIPYFSSLYPINYQDLLISPSKYSPISPYYLCSSCDLYISNLDDCINILTSIPASKCISLHSKPLPPE